MSSAAQEVEPFPRHIFILGQGDENAVPIEAGQFNPEYLAGFSIHAT